LKNSPKINGSGFFIPPGRRFGHQIMIEEGYCFSRKKTMAVASDTVIQNMYGGNWMFGLLQMLELMPLANFGQPKNNGWQFPPIAKVELKGKT
jgi:aconitase A